MAAASSPIKVDTETDQLATDAAHFLNLTKKDVVDRAVREYVENHRDEIHAGVQDSLRRLDGSVGAAVSMLTGMSLDEIDAFGGLPK